MFKLVANEAMQHLTRAEEVALCEFIQIMGAEGYPTPVKMVRRMAEEIAFYQDRNGDFETHAHIPPFGVNWMTKFAQRNSGVKAMFTRARDVKRTKGTQPERIQPFYLALKDLGQRC
jgi:hypothetical protein